MCTCVCEDLHKSKPTCSQSSLRMKAFLVNGVFMFAALACLTSIFIGISDAQVSAVASFNDSRCNEGTVCSNDPLLFTCTVTESNAVAARVTLPSGEAVQVTITNMTEVVGATPLPDGVTVVSNNSVVAEGLVNYTLTLAIERASLLGSNPVICDARTVSPQTDEKSCPIATDPGPPESLSQNISANTNTSAVVQWGSPATMTGGTGVTISEYRVIVDGGMNQTIGHDDSGDVFTATITVPKINTNYSVSVTAINSCGLSSQPATTTVLREARVPPRPQSVSLSMECSVSRVRSVNISWMDGMREDGIMYPGEQTTMVVLTPGNIECTVAGTRCTANITEDNNYTFNLTLNNNIGSSAPVIDSFNSEILFSDETLNSLPSSVNITVNRFCATDGKLFQITVRFGVTTDTRGSCSYMGASKTENYSTNGNQFSPNFTLTTGESFCYMANLTIDGRNVASLNGSGDTTPTESPTPDPNPANIGLIIGVVVAVFILIIVVIAIVLIVVFVIQKNKRPKEGQESQESQEIPLKPTHPEEGGQEAGSIARTAHPETGEIYTEVSKPRNTEQAPTTIEHHEGPSGDLYAMPLTSGKKGKKDKKKGKGREVEAEQQELTEEEKAAMYSVPDKKGQKARSEGLNYAELALQSSAKPAPPSQGSYYTDIRLEN